MILDVRRRSLPIAAVALAALLLSVGAAFARGYMTPGFRSKQSRPMTLAVLPPHADFIKSKVVMTDQMLAESAALEREASQALKSQLEAKGYRVRLVTPGDLAKNQRLRDLVVKVNDRWAEEWGRIVYRPRHVKQKRFNGGGDAVRLATFLKVDGIAVTRVIAVGVTKGKAFMSGFMNMGTPSQRSYARLDLGILNGRHGLVEGFFTGYEPCSLGQLTKKPAYIMGQAAENALSRYPEAAEAEQVADDAEETTTKASKKRGGDEMDDEAAIQDFEALIKKSGAAPASR